MPVLHNVLQDPPPPPKLTSVHLSHLSPTRSSPCAADIDACLYSLADGGQG
jgi:hypothetical protein